MGSSLGISVRLTSSRVSFSSSNTTVKMAPGGVLGLLLVGDILKMLVAT